MSERGAENGPAALKENCESSEAAHPPTAWQLSFGQEVEESEDAATITNSAERRDEDSARRIGGITDVRDQSLGSLGDIRADEKQAGK